MIADLIATAAGTFGSRTALVYEGREIGFDALHSMVNAAANTLLGRGIRSGQRVLVRAPDSPELLALMLGMFRVGIVPVWMPQQLPFSHVLAVHNDTGCVSVIDDLAGWFKGSGEEPNVPLPRGEDACAVFLSSGTTQGRPKVILASHDAVTLRVARVSGMIGAVAGDRYFSPAPGFSSFAASSMLSVLAAGATCILADNACRHDIGYALLRERVTILRTPALALAKVLTEPNFGIGGLRRIVFNGKRRVPEDMQKLLKRFNGVPATFTYGIEEVGSVMQFSDADAPGKLGTPHDDVEVKIVGGEIAVRAPSLAQGYLRNGALVPLNIVDGWFLTGDLGRRDGDGHFYFKGRATPAR